jgi:hypothetical protein
MLSSRSRGDTFAKGNTDGRALKASPQYHRWTAFFAEGPIAGDTMVQLSESNTLELRIASHNAVARFEDWTTDVAEPRVRLHGRFCPISEVYEEVGHLFDSLRKGILSILYKETHAGDDILVLKIDETYRGAGRRLLQLIEKRKDEIQRRKALRS